MIRPLAAIGAIEKRSGGSRSDVLEGGRYSGIPYNRRCAVLTTAISQGINPADATYVSAPFHYQPNGYSQPWDVTTYDHSYSGAIARNSG